MHQHDKHGSLGGHVLPGFFFIVWAIWWFVNVSCIYIYRTKRKKGFSAQAHYRLAVLPKWQLEPVCKVVLPLLGIAGELYLSHHAHWRCVKQSRQSQACVLTPDGSSLFTERKMLE